MPGLDPGIQSFWPLGSSPRVTGTSFRRAGATTALGEQRLDPREVLFATANVISRARFLEHLERSAIGLDRLFQPARAALALAEPKTRSLPSSTP